LPRCWLSLASCWPFTWWLSPACARPPGCAPLASTRLPRAAGRDSSCTAPAPSEYYGPSGRR
jgi:hypothetical protein